MARPKPHEVLKYHCGMCDQSFEIRSQLKKHIANHADTTPSKLPCPVCNWKFDDSHSLAQHLLHSGHGNPQFACEKCNKPFISKRGLDDHTKSPLGCESTMAVSSSVQPLPAKVITCDRCPDTFTSQREYNAHRSFPEGQCADHKKRTPPKVQLKQAPTGYIDLDRPGLKLGSKLEYDDSLRTPDNLSEEDDYCKRAFKSKASFNLHALGCSAQDKVKELPAIAGKSSEALHAVDPMIPHHQTVDSYGFVPEGQQSSKGALHTAALEVITNKTNRLALSAAPHQARPMSSNPASSSSSALTSVDATSAFLCKSKGCGKSFKSEVGLRAHNTDIHGIGGKAIDLHGGDSYMMNPRIRDQLKAQGLLRDPSRSTSSRGRGGRSLPAMARRSAPYPLRTLPEPVARSNTPAITRAIRTVSSIHRAPPQATAQHVPIHATVPVQTTATIDNAAEMEQAKHIQGKIVRVLIQSDILIQHDGKMTVCGIDWVRIPVSKQDEALTIFDGMCHLPKKIQTEYLPIPIAFKDEYGVQYPVGEFEHPPEHDPSKPGLGILALSCSKVVLTDGRQEIVKIAAVDVTTCRILINHLVCTDPRIEVANWRSLETGLSSWGDMEVARQAGYKVFKGWLAVRSALWKFVDRNTIIVGHNLRSDLDALRMMHGRAVDVAKLVEKAANGPLSKIQLSLDSLSRTHLEKDLKSDPAFGRDCLMDAFAARELALWSIKNKEKLGKDAKQKSLDYQKVMPKTAA